MKCPRNTRKLAMIVNTRIPVQVAREVSESAHVRRGDIRCCSQDAEARSSSFSSPAAERRSSPRVSIATEEHYKTRVAKHIKMPHMETYARFISSPPKCRTPRTRRHFTGYTLGDLAICRARWVHVVDFQIGSAVERLRILREKKKKK